MRYLILSLLLLSSSAYALQPGIPGNLTYSKFGCFGYIKNTEDKKAVITTNLTEAGHSYICEIIPYCTGTAAKVGAYLQDIDTSSRQMSFAIYDSDGVNGEPGTLLVSTPPDWNVSPANTLFSSASPVPDAGGDSTFVKFEKAISGAMTMSRSIYAGFQFKDKATGYKSGSDCGKCRKAETTTWGEWPSIWPEKTDIHDTGCIGIWLNYD